MWALVEDNAVTKVFTRPKALTLGDNQYPANIFSLWSSSELEAIGIYEVVIDNTNLKNEKYYINTNQSFAFASGTVTASYGTATAKPIADTLYTEQNKTDGVIPGDKDVGDVAIEGLKTIKKKIIDNQCAGLLAPSDWMATKAFEEGGDVESGWKTWRASVRTKCNSMQTQINNAANVDALAALFIYTEQEDKSFTRPLGEFPIKE